MKNTTLIFLALFAFSCKKNNSGNVYGTYNGTVHEYGSWSYFKPNGEHNTGSTDTFYTATIEVTDYSADSIKFRFGTQVAIFRKSAANTYCQACDPARNLNRYRFVLTQDSLYYNFRAYGGSSTQAYSDQNIEFAGKR